MNAVKQKGGPAALDLQKIFEKVYLIFAKKVDVLTADSSTLAWNLSNML